MGFAWLPPWIQAVSNWQSSRFIRRIGLDFIYSSGSALVNEADRTGYLSSNKRDDCRLGLRLSLGNVWVNDMSDA